MTLKTIIENNDTRAGWLFDITIQCLILISVFLYTIDTLPNLNENTRSILSTLEAFIIIIFTIEYILRIMVSDRKIGYIFSFYGIVDLIAILPYYLTMGTSFFAIRLIRILRLFRLLKLARYSKAMQRFYKAFIIAREELVLFFVVTLILLYLAAAGIYLFEYEAQPDKYSSIPHSLWWSVATLTTVGYGDVYPITIGGRIFTFFILMIGLGIVAVPAGLLASAMTEVREQEEESKKYRV